MFNEIDIAQTYSSFMHKIGLGDLITQINFMVKFTAVVTRGNQG